MSSGTGGMSPTGTTNLAPIRRPQLDSADKKVLCSAMCQCDKTPNVGKDGRQLKQVCVAERLKGLDKLLEHRSVYKEELNYDMTKTPPAPIMDSTIDTKGHDYLPGWIKKYWGTEPEHPPKFSAGRGLIRRPDVVIVKDPSKPPTQDNIKQIVEMKFPPDSMSPEQKTDYETIAGDEKKLRTLEPSDCDCNAPEPEGTRIPVESLGWAAFFASVATFALSRGKTPVPVMP